jgi:hypothetical protein
MININIPHDRVPIVLGEEVFGVISGGSLHVNPRSSSQQKHMKRIRIKHHAKQRYS